MSERIAAHSAAPDRATTAHGTVTVSITDRPEVSGMDRRTFLPALMFPNSGNIGLPTCLFAFGEQGLALAVSFFAMMIMLQFTVGIGIASGRVSLRTIITAPVLYAVAAAPFAMEEGRIRTVGAMAHLVGRVVAKLDELKLRFTDQFAKFSDLGDPNFDDFPSSDPFATPFEPSNVITRPSKMNDDEDIVYQLGFIEAQAVKQQLKAESKGMKYELKGQDAKKNALLFPGQKAKKKNVETLAYPPP